MTEEVLFGLHSVREALKADRREMGPLWMQGTGSGLAEVGRLARRRRVAVQKASPEVFRNLDRKRAHHQGVALRVSPLPRDSVDGLCHLAAERHEPPFLLILDHIQDPQNAGAMIRSAELCGIHGVVIPTRRACPMTPAVSHASAGALEHMRVAPVTNLSRAVDSLKRQGIWVGGLDAEDARAQAIESMDLNRPLALVVGHEGEGLSRLTRDRCDFLLGLSMHGQIESYNAASAASIALYLARQAR